MENGFKPLLVTIATSSFVYPLLTNATDSLRELSLKELMNIEISTTSKYEEKLRDTPANVHVFTHEQIRERGYASLLDILQSLPGIQVQNFSAQSSLNLLTTRGVVGNNKFLFLQDGVRISSPASERLAIFENFPIYYAKQIEVLIGPASVSYGADAYMGVINIITMNSEEQDVAELSITTGQDNYRTGYAHLSRKLADKIHVTLGAQVYQSQDYKFDENFPELYDDPNKNYNFANSQVYNLMGNISIGQKWKAGFNHTAYSYSHDFTVLPKESAFDQNAKEQVDMKNIYLSYKAELSNALKTSTLLNMMRYELENGTYFNNNFSGFKPGYKYGKSDRLSLNQDFELKFAKNHYLSGGLVFDYFDVIPVGADLPAPYDTSKSPEQQALTYPNTDIPVEFFARSFRNYGFYLQDNWAITQQWRLVAGLRHDNNSLYGESTNPSISVIYKHNESNVFKLLYGHAFVAPSSDQMFRHFGGFSGEKNSEGEWESDFFQLPNPDLKPEKSKTVELNYAHWFDEQTHLKIASYYITISDVIQSVGDNTPDQVIPGANIGFTQKSKNIADSKSYGVDVSIAKESSFAYQTALNSWANLSWVEGTLRENGIDSELPVTAKYRVTTGLTLSYRNKYLVTPKLLLNSSTTSYKKDPGDDSKLQRVPSYYRLDLHGQIKLTKRLVISATVFNLLDTKYTNVVEGDTSYKFLEAPQPGRLISFTLKYDI